MADHIQDQILDYYQALLAGGGTAAAANVYVEPVDPVPVASLPAVVLEAADEDSSPTDASSLGYPRVMQRFFGFKVHSIVALADGYGKAARGLAGEVEALICGSLQVQQAGGAARDGVHLFATEFRRDTSVEKPVYVVTQLWRAGYICRANAPDTPL